MKYFFILAIFFCITDDSIAQLVINAKGTKILVDSSKWKITGNNIYYKNAGNVGIGTILPTAQLHTTSDVRFQGIGTNTTNTKILTTDLLGNVTTRTLSNLLIGSTISSLNGSTNSSQTFATGTTGTSFNIVTTGAEHVFNLPIASATNSGALSTANWTTFNNKIGTVTATTAAAVSTSSITATINNTGAYWNANQLQGNNISTTAPTTGQILSWNGTAWAPQEISSTTTTNSMSSTNNTITSTVNGIAATANLVNSISNTSAANNMSTTINGITSTPVSIINSISNTSSTNSLTTTVNGIQGSSVNIINSNTLTQNGTNQLVSTVNGIANTALTINSDGDVTGDLGATVVSKINGSPLGTITGASSGQVLGWNGTAWAPATLVNNTNAAVLSANFTTSSTAAASTNLKFAIAANESYYVRIEGTASKATSSTGLKLAIAAPSGCTISGEAFLGGGALNTALAPSLISAINTLGTAFATATGVRVAFSMTFVVTNSSTAGNITLQAATVSANTATIYAGTRMSWTKATGL